MYICLMNLQMILDINAATCARGRFEILCRLCHVIISHDRWFLDRVCTHILAFEGDSTAYWFEGGYSEYEENKKKRLGNVEPKRVRYKKLTV